MPKRAAASLIWFAAVWVGYEIVWSLTGVPRLVGPISAFAVASTVALDPLALFWPRGAATRSGTAPAPRPVTESTLIPH